jgi:hypothetical protein
MKKFNTVLAVCLAAGWVMSVTADSAVASGIISGKDTVIYGKGNGPGNGTGNGGSGPKDGTGNGKKSGTCTNLIPDTSHDGILISGKGNGPGNGTGNGSKSGTCTKLIMDVPSEDSVYL